MEGVDCGSASISERRDCTAHGYRRFRCRDCGRQFNERSGGVLNRTQYPSEVIALVVLRRLRYRRTLQDLTEMFLQSGIVFSHETVHEWEAKLTPILTHEVRQRRRGRAGAGRQSLHVDETYLKVRGRWCYFYRAIDRDGALVDTMLSEHRDGEGILSLREVRHRPGPGSGHYGWTRLLSARNPFNAGPPRRTPNERLQKQPAGARPSGRERPYPMYAWLQGIWSCGAILSGVR